MRGPDTRAGRETGGERRRATAVAAPAGAA